jgi:predicted nucleic acid-binding protein
MKIIIVEKNIIMELMQGLLDNVLGIIGSGTITREDYYTVLIPAMKDKLQRHKKIRMLYQLNKDLCTIHSMHI